jgi:hypothetical protein
MSLHHRIESTFHQLRDRKVLKVAAVYAVVAWILMQIGEVAFDPLQLPSWSHPKESAATALPVTWLETKHWLTLTPP